MSLYKQLLIDIMYSLRQENSNFEYASLLEFMDRQKLSIDYQITETLIDIVFEILKGEVIKFDPNLRTHKDFLEVKEQISQSESLVDIDLDPMIRSEEFEKIEDPIIRGIMLDQELLAQHQVKSSHSRSTLLFLHLMFLSFPEIRNNSIMTNRKQVLLNLFGQSTYKYQFTESDNEPKNKDQVQSQVIEGKQAQDIREYNFKQTQTDFQPETPQPNVIKITQIPEYKFYFSCQVPIEIEQLSSHSIKMTFSKGNQSVYRWSELDQSSYFNLITTHSKAFDSWTTMLNLLNQQLFSEFINGQLQDDGSDYEVVQDINQKEQQIIDKVIELDNIVRIDNKQSIVKLSNKVILMEQCKLQVILKSIKQQLTDINNLVSKRNSIESLITQIQINEKQVTNKTIENQRSCAFNDFQLPLERQEIRVDQGDINYNDKLMKGAIYNQEKKFTDGEQPQKRVQITRLDQQASLKQAPITFHGQNLQNIHAQKLIPVLDTTVSLDRVIQHEGQWKFSKHYPNKIYILSNSRLLMQMNGKEMILIEWWQFDYDSLNNLLLTESNLVAAQVWSIMLILIDEQQFYKLWKGEVLEQIQIKEQDQEPQQKQSIQEIVLQQGLQYLPEIIIKNDHYRFIMKFKNSVQIFKTKMKKIEHQIDNIIQEYEEKNGKIQFRPAYYNSKIKIFEERILKQKDIQIRVSLPDQITYKYKLQYQDILQKKIIQDQQLHKGQWIFNDDYPLRISIVSENIHLQFKNTKKNTIVKWEQLDYHSLINLIERRINITAGYAWSVMLILLDHEQFYHLWKNYHLRNINEMMFSSVNESLKANQQSIASDKLQQLYVDKRDPPDYIPQKIIRLNEQKLIVKFERYVQVFTNSELAQYRAIMEIPEAEFNRLRIKWLQWQYNQNIKSFQERLNFEESQQE